MKTLDGRVVLVDGGGGTVGRAIALALAAAGARLVVCGPEECPLGETVGEIAYGGGKARHVVGALAAAAARAVEVFGPVDLVVATHAECKLLDGVRAIVVAGEVDEDTVGALVVAVAGTKAAPRKVTIEA